MFRPDLMADKVTDISPSQLAKEGIRAVILDIDDTLVPHGETKLPAEILEWLREIDRRNIKIAFLSNNKIERHKGLVPGIRTLYVSSAAKPRRKGYQEVFRTFSIKPSEAIMIGDQLFTDILGANRSGCRSALVVPVAENPSRFFKFKRRLEKPLLRKYRKSGNIK